MKVCKVTCDCCEKEITNAIDIGMGELGFNGNLKRFSRWFTFHLCKDCYHNDNARSTFKIVWPKFNKKASAP